MKMSEYHTVRRTHPITAGFGLQTKKCGQPPEGRKSQEIDFSPEPPESNAALMTP